MKINFVLAANNSSSQTRVAAEFANHLVRRGVDAVVSVPWFNFLDFVLWHLQRDPAEGRFRSFARWITWLYLPLAKSFFFRTPWFARTGHFLDPKVRVNRYWFVPLSRNMPDADVMVATQVYLVPHLLYLPPRKGKVVSSIRLDYAEGTRDPHGWVRDWCRFIHSFYEQLRVPLFAVSQRVKESALAMGIPVQAVIPNGVNTEEFTDGGRRGEQDPVRVTLFVHHHPQKGQDFGCAVIRRLRQLPLGRKVLFCTVGSGLKPEHRGLFDHHYGYLTGKAYVRMYQETDVLIFPSHYEGFPAIPLEAMASGCALATTLVSGVEEYARPGENCMACRPGDLETMVRNVQRLISDVALRDTIRDNGVRTAKRYSWQEAADRLLEFVSPQPALPEPRDTVPGGARINPGTRPGTVIKVEQPA